MDEDQAEDGPDGDAVVDRAGDDPSTDGPGPSVSDSYSCLALCVFHVVQLCKQKQRKCDAEPGDAKVQCVRF